MQVLFTKSLIWPGLGRGAKRLILAPALNPPLPRPIHVGQAIHRLDAWLCLSRVTRLPWSRRLPAVGIAGVLLTTYAWSAGIEPVDVRWALGLGLAAALLGLHTDSTN